MLVWAGLSLAGLLLIFTGLHGRGKKKCKQRNKVTLSLTPANYAEIQESNENHKAFAEIRAPNLP